MQQTSLEAYYSPRRKKYEGRQHKIICDTLAVHGDLSNKEISEIVRLPINVVTARVFELRESGIVKDRGIKQGDFTKVKVWGV